VNGSLVPASTTTNFNLTASAVPEPGSMGLIAFGGALLLVLRKAA